jgi:hypothetical protein
MSFKIQNNSFKIQNNNRPYNKATAEYKFKPKNILVSQRNIFGEIFNG